jgi:outer membrane protein assembly factor BamB
LNSSSDLTYRLAVRTTVVAAAFSVVVAALLAYDYWRRDMKDPSQTTIRETLKAAQKQQPDNKELNEKLRQLDEDSRQEYFRQKWFATGGAALLCGGIIVFLAAARWAAVLGRRLPPLPQEAASSGDWQTGWTPAARWTVAGLFVILCVAGIGFAVPAWKASRESEEQQSARGKFVATSSANPTSSAATPQPTGAVPSPDKPKASSSPAPPPPLSAEELARAWPSFRGRGGSGISPYTNVPDDWDGPSGKNILWKTPVPLPGNSSPIVVAGRVFLTGGDQNQRQVYCFDAASGKQLWQADVPSTPESRKLELEGEFAKVPGFAACTMATDGRYVAAIFANGDLAAYDLSGKLAWSKSLGIPTNVYGHAASLAVYKNLLLVPFDQGEVKAAKAKLHAFDIATGHVAWEQSRPVRASWTSPIVVQSANRDQLITVSNPWAIAYDPADGKELWRVKMENGDAAPSPVAAGDIVIAIVDDNSPITAIRADGKGDVSKTHVLWKGEDNMPAICCPLATKEFVFVVNMGGTLTCYDLHKGDKLWEEDLAEFKSKSSPSLVGKQLYLFGEDGKCWILAPSRSGVKRVRQVDLGEPCVTCPAFQDGRMFVRGEKSLICIGKK